MRRAFGLVAAWAVALSLAGAARAAPMSFTGTIELRLGNLAPLIITGQTGPGGAIVNGSSGGGHLSALTLLPGPADVRGAASVVITGGSPVTVRATATLGTGTLAPISGGGPLTRNTLPIRGIVKICLVLPGCQIFVPIPLHASGTRGVGIGGLITVGGFAPSGVKISVNAAPWTVGTAVLSGIPTTNGGTGTSTAMGFAHGPQSLTSSTAKPSGVVQLVTPVLVQTSIANSALIPMFGTLTIRLVPEPGTLLLLGSGFLALGVAARRRR